MDFKRIMEKLIEWTNLCGTDDSTLENFCYHYADTYEEYMSIWHIVNDFKANL